jgi:hypothetical protein
MEKIKMKELETKLAHYKMIINSNYGENSRLVTDVYSEVFKLRGKIRTVKIRKSKIKNLFNGR